MEIIEVVQNDKYPFTRKGEIFFRYSIIPGLWQLIWFIESKFRHNPNEPKYIYKKD